MGKLSAGRIYSGILILFSFLSYFLVFGISWSVGVFYVVFLENLEYSSPPAVALGTALNSALVYAVGPLASILINSYGSRVVGLLGGVLAAGGLVLTIFSRNVFYMCCMFGLVCGSGLGFANTACNITIIHHFDKYRPLAVGFASSAIGAGTFVYPPLMRYLTETFGWRGAILILGGITSHILLRWKEGSFLW